MAIQGMIRIGQVLKPQGIDGLVKVKAETDDPGRFLALSEVWLDDAGDKPPVPVSEVAVRDGMVFLRLNGAGDRNTAEAQRGLVLFVPRQLAVDLPPDTNFIVDLIGLNVKGHRGQAYGKLIDVLQPGAQDVYCIKGAQGTIMVPALKKLVLSVDLSEGAMTLDEDVFAEVAVLDD